MAPPTPADGGRRRLDRPVHPARLAHEDVRDAARGQSLFERTERGALLIMADFDGTLAPIADTPGEARLAPPARKVLARLATAHGVWTIWPSKPS